MHERYGIFHVICLQHVIQSNHIYVQVRIILKRNSKKIFENLFQRTEYGHQLILLQLLYLVVVSVHF